MQQSKKVILVCGGDVNYRSPGEICIYVSPLTAWRTAGPDNFFILLGDYSPDESTAQDADESLYHQIETCLELESEKDNQRRWWPLAYRRLMARLSRYRWLKGCLREIVLRHRASVLTITSGEDRDLIMAAQAVGEKERVLIEVLPGEADPPLNIDHMVRQTGLALRIDPTWLTCLQSFIWKFHSSQAMIAYQPYWNLNLAKAKNCFPLFINRIASVAATIQVKISQFSIFKSKCKSSYYDLWAADVTPAKLGKEVWEKKFTEDERVVIAQVLGTFIKEYPSESVDRAGRALKKYLQAKYVQTVLLMHDRLDSCRLLAWAAHEVGVRVDYLPHGLIFEGAAGQKSNSAFSPDRILAWNTASAKSFEKYGWKTEVVAHPHFDRPALKFKKLNKKWRETKVLILMADWVYLTAAGREDCAWVWYKDILKSLRMIGVADENIHIKLHQFNPDTSAHYENIARCVDLLLDVRPRRVSQLSRVSDILQSFDLVILSLTTGIYECALNGIPYIVYGMSAERVGVLREIYLPHARNPEELLMALASYDNERALQACARLCAVLQEGRALESVYLKY